MNGTSTKLSHPDDEAPLPKYTSKICSPTKRTLNNKNYLAEEAPVYNRNDHTRDLPPVPVPVFTNNPESARNSNSNRQRQDTKLGQYHTGFHRLSDIKVGNSRLRSRPNAQQYHQQQQLTYENARNNGNNNVKFSSNRLAKPTTQTPKISTFVEIRDSSEIVVPNPAQKQRILAERYFSAPIDFAELQRETGKHKPIINIVNTNSPGQPKNGQIYKLSVPILSSHKGYHVIKDQIKDIYRSKYQVSQPLYAFGNENVRYSSLKDLESKDINNASNKFSSKRLQSTQVLDRQLLAASNGNDSFELSFDGKALDRSDIFRMVDSFTVALSDDDDEDKIINAANKNLLPSEMTNSVY
ncbi:hypothetical protein HG535_0C05710 [Zygotorulaspora mrakii]|uniref:Uncharacterized protein n=1 Tax=Zygotorulaspora mrakii TaxID=42260 RepID=A0A7H9B149_ZYGMR|nr:uncharacterized protein HG535_0C05710 [Zygotorulaspora mrakii]QLG72217.1 hypothetical protein HG535_0C05710 [Zygotorulaspora mrakii]